MTDAALPKAVELMWGMQRPGTRGPRRGLTLEQIVDAAIAVADAEGAGALSMNRVAKHLGFTAMSLYRYVDSKDTLLDLVMDRVVGPPPEIAPDLPWRAALEQWARTEFERIGAHPWWVDLPISRPPLGPNNLGWLDAGLRTLAATAVPEPVKLQLAMNLSMFVIGKRRAARDLLTEEDSDFGEVLATVLGQADFPAISAALSASAFTDEDDIDWEQADFEFGLARMLDGYEVFIRTFDT